LNIIHRIVLISALLAPGAVGIAHAKAAATFGTEIGGALLCKDQLDNKYFFDYLSASFGAPYKQEGGAYWFRTPGASLWGVEVTDVMVNDPNSPAAFVGARVKMNPFALSQLISKNAGILFSPQDSSGYPLRESPSGSIIAYDNMTAKIYCAKSKYLVPGYVDQ
jgi:hypothetical protein